MKLSIVIPARNEFPHAVFTFYSIVHALEVEGFTHNDFEIIIVNNCSTDRVWPKRGTGGTTDYMYPRGAYNNRILRTYHFPIAGNHAARNRGAEMAKGEYIYFSDAHMAYRPGFFTKMIRAAEESGGLAHGHLQFMGAYPPTDKAAGVSYTLKLGEEIKGTWNNYPIGDMKTWFYVPAQGHWGVMVNKKQFLDFGGYPEFHRTYGGGEFYLDMKWWMFGSTVVTQPDAIGYHLASGRGYSYHHDDYIHNVFNVGYALGMDDWTERAYINWCRRGRKEVLDFMMSEAKEEMQSDREFIKKRSKYSFNELIVERPWQKLNQEKFDYSIPGLMVFHDTWLQLLRNSPDYVQELYDNSKLQKGLEKFINENLSELVYKRPKKA